MCFLNYFIDQKNQGNEQGRLSLYLLFSAAIGIAYSYSIFSHGFLLGENLYWADVVSDRAANLIGYLYFLKDEWRWPLFYVPTLSMPEGTSIIFTDSIPLVSLLFKLINKFIISHTFNFFGLWIALCYILTGVSVVAVLYRLRIRGVGITLAVTLLALMTPVLLNRWFHAALSAQFLLVVGLYFYVRIKDTPQPTRLLLLNTFLLVASLLIHVYLLVMVYAIFLTMLARGAVCLRVITKTYASLACAGTLFLLVVLMLLLGHIDLDQGLTGGGGGYGHFSMNLFSPFFSYSSGFLPAAWQRLEDVYRQHDSWPFFLHGGGPDATGGQYYEGFSYFGIGIMFLIVSASPYLVRHYRDILRQHWPLLLVIGATSLFALSNHLCAGTRLLYRWELPGVFSEIFWQFRSSGRFFWVTIYALLIFLVTANIRFYGPKRGIMILILAVLLQVVDTAPLRQAVSFTSKTPVSAGLDSARWISWLAGKEAVYVIPSNSCGDPNLSNPKLQLQLIAARNGVLPTNSTSAARSRKDCEGEKYLWLEKGSKSDRALYVFFEDGLNDLLVNKFIKKNDAGCQKFSRGIVCFQ